MSKNINWGAQYKQPMRGKLGGKYASRKEQLQKSYAQVEELQKKAETFKKMEPLLKQSLLDHMVNRKPIRVIQPLAYFTEELIKSENSTTSLGTFSVVKKVVNPGTELVFVKSDENLGQWLFKASTGEEVEIYSTPTISLSPDHVVQNPGFWGLLTNTHLYRDMLNLLGDET
jgi:hypothetical protein